MVALYELEFGVSDFVAVANQTLEYAYPSVVIIGELANFKVSKNKWVYFDLKDEFASLRFFGTVYQLNTPLEDGMLLRVKGSPRLHPQFGFSITVSQIELVGEGTAKKAATLLEKKLAAEGLFDPARKRLLPYPPARIGLIASGESAAYVDFSKIINQRWAGLEIQHVDVLVQGADAPEQIVNALNTFNQQQDLLDVLIITRGGGSAEDLQAFNAENVVRAVAGSRIPTLVAIGHERDFTLAELVADVRASTPSHAAEILTPDKKAVLGEIKRQKASMAHALDSVIFNKLDNLNRSKIMLENSTKTVVGSSYEQLLSRKSILQAYDPDFALRRGYALARINDKLIRNSADVAAGDIVNLEIVDAILRARVEDIQKKGKKYYG